MISTQISPDVSTLVEAFTAVKAGETVTYETLSKVISRDIRQCYWLVMSAQRIAARDHGAVFANKRKVGFQRLETEELHTIGSTARHAVRRRVRSASKMIKHGASRMNFISPEAGRKMNAELSALALLDYAAKDVIAKPVAAHDERPEPVAFTAKRLMDALSAV